ncbi:MAG: DUF4149 domain-containing protein [Burkholderiales bacterium]|nr:DUF4149 domain-containing protein [Burkholderiales bacterium]
MYTAIKFLHLVSAVVWLGGMTFMLLALRPALGELLPPPQRLPLLAGVLRRFFTLVWGAVLLLLLSGGFMMSQAGALAMPIGWHLMAGIGVLMCLIFGHLYFGPYRRLQAALAAADWPEGGRRANQIALLVTVNFRLGWLVLAAITFLA